MEGRGFRLDYQGLLQTLILLGGLIIFAMNAEHRLTVLEVEWKNARDRLESCVHYQQLYLEFLTQQQQKPGK
jgi:hypothetical protein